MKQYQPWQTELWAAICPALYRDTVPSRIPDQAQLERVLGWEYNAKGLLLTGPTGAGKTRSAWLLLASLFFDQGRRIKAFDGIGWGIAVSAAYGEPSFTEEWLDQICKSDILFLDDLFKAKMTEAQEQALYGVFERRSAWMRPTIVTMNSTGRMILERMTEQGRADRGEPLLRRMAEFCDVIEFSNGDKTL